MMPARGAQIVESGGGPRLYLPRDPKQMKKGGLPAVVGDFVLPWSPFGPPWSPLGPPLAPVVSHWAPVVFLWAPVVSHWAPVGRRGPPLGGSINNHHKKKHKDNHNEKNNSKDNHKDKNDKNDNDNDNNKKTLIIKHINDNGTDDDR